MRLLTSLACGALIAILGRCPAAAQDAEPAAAVTTPSPTTVELIEDLRIFTILNSLQPSRDQASRLAAVAVAGKEGLSGIEAEVKKTLDQQRAQLLAAREKALRGGATPPMTDAQLADATRSAEATRTQKTELLILALAARVRRILSPEQAARVENDLAPTADQPWRRYARMLTGPQAQAGARRGSQMPADPGKWLHELRDLRVDSAEGDPAHEINDFARKLTRGLPANTPLYEQAFAQGRAFATQVLAMPQEAFNQREWELARLAARHELEARNRQREAEGKPLETFDPYRWFVEMVILSPRAATDLRERAAAR